MTCSYTKLRIAAALQRTLGGLSAPNPTTAPAAALWLTALTSACEDPNGSQRHSTDATDGPSAEPDSTPTRSDSVVKGRHESDASSERDAAVTPGAERNRALEPSIPHDASAPGASVPAGDTTPAPPRVDASADATGSDAGSDPEAQPSSAGRRDASAVSEPGRDADAPCAITYAAGHGDVHLSYDDELGLVLGLRSHLQHPEPAGPAPVHPPEEVCILVPWSSWIEATELGGRPSLPDFEPMGIAEGESFWFLSQNNRGASQPFLGVATEGVPKGEFDGALRFEFTHVETPAEARFSVYQAAFPPRFFVSTSHPDMTIDARNAITLPAGAHDHFNWTFSRPGTYDVYIFASGERGGETLSSREHAFRFVVQAD